MCIVHILVLNLHLSSIVFINVSKFSFVVNIVHMDLKTKEGNGPLNKGIHLRIRGDVNAISL